LSVQTVSNALIDAYRPAKLKTQKIQATPSRAIARSSHRML
jgi:hypothetical protein